MTDYTEDAWRSLQTAGSVIPAQSSGGVASSVAVTNFPSSQAVTVATLPLPAGGATDGTDAVGVIPPTGGSSLRGWLSGIYSKLSGTLTVAFAVAQHVIVDTAPTTPVTGTFWPVTQPVSGTVTANAGTGTMAVSLATNTPDVTDRAGRLLGHITIDNASVPVTGTFWQVTQPVSLATNTPDVTDRAGRLLGHVTVDAVPTTPVTQATLTKGTQGANGVSTQDLKDAGRTAVVLSATAVASVASETMFTLNIWKAGVVSSGTSYQVTPGKTFRLQAVQFGCRFTTPSTTVTFASCRFNVRSGTAITAPLVYGDSKMAASNAPVPNSDLAIPDGIELAGGSTIGVSHVDSAATLLLDVLIAGYEY